MSRQGFIHDKLDMKMLELYLLAQAAGPMDPDVLADLVGRHEGVNYFEFAEATAELVETGHLTLTEAGYSITDKGRTNSALDCRSAWPFSILSYILYWVGVWRQRTALYWSGALFPGGFFLVPCVPSTGLEY